MWRPKVNATYFFDYSSLLYVSQGVSLTQLTDSAVLPGWQAPEILLSLSPWFCTNSSLTLKYLGLLFPRVLVLLSLLSSASVGVSACFFKTKFLSIPRVARFLLFWLSRSLFFSLFLSFCWWSHPIYRLISATFVLFIHLAGSRDQTQVPWLAQKEPSHM